MHLNCKLLVESEAKYPEIICFIEKCFSSITVFIEDLELSGVFVM